MLLEHDVQHADERYRKTSNAVASCTPTFTCPPMPSSAAAAALPLHGLRLWRDVQFGHDRYLLGGELQGQFGLLDGLLLRRCSPGQLLDADLLRARTRHRSHVSRWKDGQL